MKAQRGRKQNQKSRPQRRWLLGNGQKFGTLPLLQHQKVHVVLKSLEKTLTVLEFKLGPEPAHRKCKFRSCNNDIPVENVTRIFSCLFDGIFVKNDTNPMEIPSVS